jgi:hypothetical protein
MTAIATDRGRSPREERWNYKRFTGASGNVFYPGAAVGLDLSTQKLEPMHAEADLFFLGHVADDFKVDATSAEKQVNVRLLREVVGFRYVNATAGDAVLAADVGKLCFFLDDQTVTITAAGKRVAGRVWDVSSTYGVLVEKLESSPLDGLLQESAAVAFVANDLVIGDNPITGTVFDVPTTAAASTVTLPATAVEGTALTFVADGTKNGHTVTYRDATGPTNLTAALTASKRHQVRAVYLNGGWTCLSTVAP